MLQTYTFTVVQVPGVRNHFPDYLSRNPLEERQEDYYQYPKLNALTGADPPLFTPIQDAQVADETCQQDVLRLEKIYWIPE